MNTSLRTLGLVAGLFVSGLVASAQTIYVDFGSTTVAGSGWNSIGSSGTAFVVSNLVNSANVATTVSLNVNNAFSNTGSGVAAGVAAFTSTASGQTHTFVTGAVNDYLAGTTTSVITFTGLDASKTYAVEIFGSRANPGGNRVSQFVISNNGRTAASTLTLETGDNISNTTFVSSFAAATDGTLTISTSPVAGGNGYFYINALALTVVASAVPEPSSFAALAGAGVLGFVALRRRRA